MATINGNDESLCINGKGYVTLLVVLGFPPACINSDTTSV